jgi:VanZ family protein
VFSKYKYLFVAFLWTVLITILSLISLGNIEEKINIDIPNKDKYVHFTFYFGFVVLWFLQIKTKPVNKKTQIIILLSAISYGILMEICQGFTETRTPDIMDILANSTGAILGLLFISRMMNQKNRNK